MQSVYLDHAATTPMAPEVQTHLRDLFGQSLANPSAAHTPGRLAMAIVENAQTTLSQRLRCRPSELFFTSGGTEANNWVIQKVMADAAAHMARSAKSEKLPRLITSSIEHSSVANVAKQMALHKQIDWLQAPVDHEGFLYLDALEELITPETILVSIAHANNEIGTIQNIQAISELCRKHRVLFHTDACQTFCHEALDLGKVPADLVTLNSHKIGGPKGIGALFIRHGTEVSPLMIGGGQQMGHRAGTLPVELIAGFATASTLWNEQTEGALRLIRAYALHRIQEKFPKAIINGPVDSSKTVSHILSFTIPGLLSQLAVEDLSRKGVYCSAGAACSSASDAASAVLNALGRKLEDARHIRVSFSPRTTQMEIDLFVARLKEVLG